MTTKTNNTTGSARKNLSIKVVGVGGAGLNIVRRLKERHLPNLSFAVLNTGALPAETPEFFHLDEQLMRNLKVADTDKMKATLAEHLARLKTWCMGADVVFVVTGMGGKTGSSVSPVVAQAAREGGALVLGFAAMPFECEGSRRLQQAAQALERLQAAADGVICLPNQKVMKLIDENTSLLDTFRISNDLLADGICGIWQLLSYSGMIEIHFDDLRELLRSGCTESVCATADTTGPNRSREVVEKLLGHPLLDGGQALTGAASVLVSVMGGLGLKMAEINRVMDQINRLCEGVPMLMGAAVDEAFADRLAVTIIAARRSRPGDGQVAPATALDLPVQLLDPEEVIHPASRFVPPPPALSPEKLEKLVAKQGTGPRKGALKMRQTQLPLEIISKGRFDKSEPTIHQGEDLDVPTYIRRGVVLN